tara:strand:- start:573 stop:683 length:111 start_codon:yes stop_codon:yes gene_type:complete
MGAVKNLSSVVAHSIVLSVGDASMAAAGMSVSMVAA